MSGSIVISDAKPRMVVVSGTTWITFGCASRMRWAVTTTAGCRKPTSRPSGSPRSRSTTSPEVSIEPIDFILPERCGELFPDTVLAEAPDRKSDSLSDRLVQLASESLQLLVGH